MAVETSAATAVSTNTISANNWFAQDGSDNTTPTSGMSPIEITFGNLSIPLGATIDGLELSIYGQGTSALSPAISITSGVDESTALYCNSSWTKTDTTRTYGGSSNLWNLSWNHLTAEQVTAIVYLDTLINPGIFFWDYVEISVYYDSPPPPPVSKSITLTSGTITLNSGKITIL